MIGYILLISIAIAISTGVYVWLKTYVPQESASCPDSIAVSIKNYSCDISSQSPYMEIIVVNNGRFDFSGMFVYANTNPDNPDSPASYDLTKEILKGGLPMNPGIQLTSVLKPGDETKVRFSLDNSLAALNAVEITPIRLQKFKGRNKVIPCNDAKIREIVSCS